MDLVQALRAMMQQCPNCKGNEQLVEKERAHKNSVDTLIESVLTSHQVRPTSQVHLGHDCIYNPYGFSLPKYVTDSNFRDKLLKVLHCCTEKTGFVHFINSIGKILEHQFNQATESKENKIFMKERNSLLSYNTFTAIRFGGGVWHHRNLCKVRKTTY